MSVAVTTRGTNFYEKYSTNCRTGNNHASSESEFLKYVQNVEEHREQNVTNETSSDNLILDNGMISINLPEESTESSYRGSIFDRIGGGITAPYAELADENGEIKYNGAVFQVDYDSNSISLGDCSPGANYLTIPLPDSGGCLKVNRNNLGQLMDAISMFSPRDRWAIIRAVSTDSYCERVKKQVEEEEDFSNIETGNYSVTKDSETGYITIRDKKSGNGIKVSSREDIVIQKDAATGIKMLVNDFGGGFYTSIQVTDELEQALKTALHTDTLKETGLEGFQIHTDARTGIQYMTANGYESRGGSLLLDDEGRKKLLSLAEEYLTSYPDKISNLGEAITYAAFEITGILERTENGFTIKNNGVEPEKDAITKQEILVKADGSRVLMLTVKTGDIQTVMSLELTSKESSLDGQTDLDLQKAVEEYVNHLK